MTIKLPLRRHFASTHCEVLTENEKPLYGNEVVCAAGDVAQLEAAYAELEKDDQQHRDMIAGMKRSLKEACAKRVELESERDGLRKKVMELDNKLYLGYIPIWRCENNE